MSRTRFVEPATRRYYLADGDDWVEVKERLNYSEVQRLSGAALGKISGMTEQGEPVPNAEPEVGLDLERFGVERLYIWLADWSFRDEQGKSVRLTRSAVRNLDPETVEELDAILTQHQAAQDEAKKATRGRPDPVPS